MASRTGLCAPVLLASIGGAQWLVLHCHRPGSLYWVAATAGAWMAGLLVFVGISSPLWHPGQDAVAVAVVAGAATAVTTTALTGLAAVRLATPARGPTRASGFKSANCDRVAAASARRAVTPPALRAGTRL